MASLLDSLSEAALDALRRRVSARLDDAGFVELAGHHVEGMPLARRGTMMLGRHAWSLTLYGLGLSLELAELEGDRSASPAL